MKKFLTYMLWGILGLILVLYLAFRFLMPEMSMSEADIKKKFSGQAASPTFHTYQVGERTMHYAAVGEEHLPTLLFIHGSPGSWDAYADYFLDPALLERFRMISVDRIGYGGSTEGDAESSVRIQAEMIYPILKTRPDSLPMILVGHSFGGPIAARMAMDYADEIDGLVVLAGLADPDLESRPAILGPFRSKALRWLLPLSLDISNREIFTCKRELIEMDPMWNKIRARTLVVQGDKDILVEKENADYMERKITNAPVDVIRLPKENHFIVWTQKQMISDQLLKMLKALSGS